MTTNTGPEAWVALPAEAEVRAMFGGQAHPYEKFMGGVVGRMPRLMMAHPAIGQALATLGRTLLFGPGVMSRAERELVAAVTSAANDCHY